MRKEIAMGKKTKRKDNKRHLRPPLTFLDKSIYFLCIVFSFLGALLLAFCFDDIQNMIAFNMPRTVAYRSNASFLKSAHSCFLFQGGNQKSQFSEVKNTNMENILSKKTVFRFSPHKNEINIKRLLKRLLFAI